MRASILWITSLIGLISLSACGGGGGGTSGPPTPPSTYTVGGTVSGLSGSGLVLQNNGANNYPVAGSGNFTFSPALNSGSAYAVTVLTQPSTPTQACAVSNGSGTVSANVTNVSIACTTNNYAVGGTVSGLTGTGLVLQNNGGNNLSVTANGGITFTTSVMSGSNYNVAVSTQPTGQTCSVTGGSGTVTNAAITNVSIACRAQVAKFLYVPNAGSNSVSIYSINASTGALTAVGSPVSADQSPSSVATDPTEKFLYLTNLGSASSPPKVSAYAINSSTGALTQNGNSPFPLSVASPPANYTGNAVDGFSSIVMHMHSSGKFGFATNHSDGKLYGATLNSTTGDLTEIGGMPISLAPGPTLNGLIGTYDSTGKFFYISHNTVSGSTLTAGYVSAFQVNATTGALTLIGGSATATGGSYTYISQLDPSGKFLIVTNATGVNGIGNGSVAVYVINSTTGALMAVANSPFAVSGNSGAVIFHPTKNWVYVLSRPVAGNGSLTVFQMDTTTGQLSTTGAAMTPIGSGSCGTAYIEPTGKFLVVTNCGTNNIQSFSIDQTNGALTEVTGSPLATDQSPQLVVDPSMKYIYTANAGSGSVSAYTFDNTTGKVTLINTLPSGTRPIWPAVVGKQ